MSDSLFPEARLAAWQKGKTPAEAARDEALARVAQSQQSWMRQNWSTLVMLARHAGEFTTDDLWACVTRPPEPRAMGHAVKAMQKKGLIEPTGRYRKSLEVSCHARPKAVWRWIA